MKNNKRKIKISIISIILIFIFGIAIYEATTYNKTYYISEKNIEIPIFLYHDIVEEKEQIVYDYMQTDKETFEKQIKGLLKLNYRVISYEELIKYKNGEIALPKRVCLIDFDDGYEGNYKVAYEIIKKYNIPVNIYIVNNCIGTTGYMNWEQLEQLDKSGLVTINTHSSNHNNFNTLNKNEAVQDVVNAHKQIEQKLGHTQIKVFTYPCGLYKEEIIDGLEKEEFIQNLTDNKINKSKTLDLSRLHRCYSLDDGIFKILLKVKYRSIRYN